MLRPTLRIVIDTSALIAILNSNDTHHADATLTFRMLARARFQLVMLRVAWIETLGQITRQMRGRDKVAAAALLDQASAALPKIATEFIEHIPDDFDRALARCRQYADWPLGYVDALIVETAMRSDADRIWTHDDRDMARLVAALPAECRLRRLSTADYAAPGEN